MSRNNIIIRELLIGFIVVFSVCVGGVLKAVTNTEVVVCGDNWSGQTDVPSGLSSVVAIAAGGAHSMALVALQPKLYWQHPYGHVAYWVVDTNGTLISSEYI